MKYIEFVGFPGCGKSYLCAERNYLYPEFCSDSKIFSIRELGVFKLLYFFILFFYYFWRFGPFDFLISARKIIALKRYIYFIKLISSLKFIKTNLIVDQGCVQAYWSYIVELDIVADSKLIFLASVLCHRRDVEIIFVKMNCDDNIASYNFRKKRDPSKITQFDDLSNDALEKYYYKGCGIYDRINKIFSSNSNMKLTFVDNEFLVSYL